MEEEAVKLKQLQNEMEQQMQMMNPTTGIKIKYYKNKNNNILKHYSGSC
jgi:hypothetical protein